MQNNDNIYESDDDNYNMYNNNYFYNPYEDAKKFTQP